jgi:hypothetical protein
LCDHLWVHHSRFGFLSCLAEQVFNVTIESLAGIIGAEVIKGSYFQGSYFQGSYFQGSYFQGSYFQGSYFQGSYFHAGFVYVQFFHMQGLFANFVYVQFFHMQFFYLDTGGTVVGKGCKMVTHLMFNRWLRIESVEYRFGKKVIDSVSGRLSEQVVQVVQPTVGRRSGFHLWCISVIAQFEKWRLVDTIRVTAGQVPVRPWRCWVPRVPRGFAPSG